MKKYLRFLPAGVRMPEYIDSNAADSMSLPEFMYKEYGRKNAAGGVSLDFEEGEVASSMFTGGAAIKGRNFSGNY